MLVWMAVSWLYWLEKMEMPLFEAFGRLGESGIVAIAVEDQVKIIGAVVPGFYVLAFCGFAPFGKNRGHFGFQLFSAFDLLR